MIGKPAKGRKRLNIISGLGDKRKYAELIKEPKTGKCGRI